MPDEQAQMLGCDFLVCREAGSTPFMDDLVDGCADCGRLLSFRPYLEAERPKVCRACFDARKDAALGRRSDA